ncbi:hypothetical protein GQX74_015533 [Glossina fuscipes]|nr:hypothetical protein GQX74_015533 [Glossina fuscipes]
MSSKRDRLQDRVEKRRILLDERQITAGSILGSCRAGSPCNAIKRWDHVTTVLAPVSVTVAENDNGSLSAMLWTHEFNMKIMKYYPIQFCGLTQYSTCPNYWSYYDLQVSPRSDDTVASNPGFSFLVLFRLRKLDLQNLMGNLYSRCRDTTFRRYFDDTKIWSRRQKNTKVSSNEKAIARHLERYEIACEGSNSNYTRSAHQADY